MLSVSDSRNCKVFGYRSDLSVGQISLWASKSSRSVMLLLLRVFKLMLLFANGALVFVACTDISFAFCLSCSTSSPDLCFYCHMFCSRWLLLLLFLLVAFVLLWFGCGHYCCSCWSYCCLQYLQLFLFFVMFYYGPIPKILIMLLPQLLPSRMSFFMWPDLVGCTMSHLASVPQGPRLRQNAPRRHQRRR